MIVNYNEVHDENDEDYDGSDNAKNEIDLGTSVHLNMPNEDGND